jgi:hypothetical protein
MTPEEHEEEHRGIRKMKTDMEAVIETLRTALEDVRAVQFLQSTKMRILGNLLEEIARHVGLCPSDDSAFQSSLQARVTRAVDERLAAMSDDDPEVASAFRKSLEKQGLLPDTTGGSED